MGHLPVSKMHPLVLILLFASSGCAMGLRITDVTFPSYVMLDQTVTLVCDYRVSEVSCAVLQLSFVCFIQISCTTFEKSQGKMQVKYRLAHLLAD